MSSRYLYWSGDFFQRITEANLAGHTPFEGDILVHENHAKLATRMLEALEDSIALLREGFDESNGEAADADFEERCFARIHSAKALLSEARAQGGSDE